MKSTEGESISVETYRALRASILYGKIAPGTKVTTAVLCQTFDASLGAVREALSRLLAEGLVSAESHRGYRVSPISVEDLRDLTRMRIDIECICLQRSLERGDARWEANLMAAAHLQTKGYIDSRSNTYPNSALHELHRDYHRALVSACDSPRLLRLRDQLFDETERYRCMEAIVAPDRDPLEEHRLITEAALVRDVGRAQTLLADHFQRTSDALIKAMTVQSPVVQQGD
jgi:DNA-binding GntR family transcriptional regulator